METRSPTKKASSWQNPSPLPCGGAAAANPWPHRLAWALLLCVFPLIWMGGTVTTYDAGMAVPDWPTTYSYWFYPVKLWLAVWDVFLEHGHRLLAQLAGLLAIALAIALWRLDERRWMRWVGAAVLVGVILQGVLGGLRVLIDDRLLARVHGCTAPLFFGLCVAVAAWTSRAWREHGGPDRPAAGRGLLRLAWLVTVLIYLEIVLGAVTPTIGRRRLRRGRAAIVAASGFAGPGGHLVRTVGLAESD